MKKRLSLSLIVLLTFVLAMTGCGSKNPAQTETGGTTTGGTTAGAEKPGSKLNIGMVTDVGGVNDNSFNQSAWEALQKLNKETGVNVKYLQSKKRL